MQHQILVFLHQSFFLRVPTRQFGLHRVGTGFVLHVVCPFLELLGLIDQEVNVLLSFNQLVNILGQDGLRGVKLECQGGRASGTYLGLNSKNLVGIWVIREEILTISVGVERILRTILSDKMRENWAFIA